MISKDAVTQLYLQYLGRPPESPDVLKYHAANSPSEKELERLILCSDEYLSRTNSHPYKTQDPASCTLDWKRYASPDVLFAATGIMPLGFQDYLVKTKNFELRVRSMLMPGELALLYALAKNRWSGHGAIVDAGPLLGLSTRVFATALENVISTSSETEPIIYSFDMFRLANDYIGYFNGQERNCATENLLHEYLLINSEFLPFILPHQGDFLTWLWPGEQAIEILFLDLAKSWALNQHAIRCFFPALVPGISVVVQQDYVHFNEYWVPITMEFFAEEFICGGFVYGATAYFELTKPIPSEKIRVDLAKLPYPEKMSLLRKACKKAPTTVKEVLKCSLAKCALDHGDVQTCKQYLEQVDTTVNDLDPLMNFSSIAAGNKAQMERLLETALLERKLL
jgi:hypothetical protein